MRIEPIRFGVDRRKQQRVIDGHRAFILIRSKKWGWRSTVTFSPPRAGGREATQPPQLACKASVQKMSFTSSAYTPPTALPPPVCMTRALGQLAYRQTTLCLHGHIVATS